MAIELAFRTGYFVVALLLLFYSRTFVLSTFVLALFAWFAYGHPADNSVGQEIVAFSVSWLAATVAAGFIGSTMKPFWLIDLEWKLVTHQRSKLGIRNCVSWLLAYVIACVAYTCTEIAGYDRGTFYRLQAMALLLLLGLVVYVYDQVAAVDSYHLLPHSNIVYHKVMTLVVTGAVLVDILVRDPPFWHYVVPIGVVWLALQTPKLWMLSRPASYNADNKKSN